jgi:hypothetical protein
VNPQVHAFDNESLVETAECQAATVASARQFCGDLPLAIGPITLKMQFNPNATGPESEIEPGILPFQIDIRQMSLFGAAWTTASLKYILESGVYSATYYETSGWLGVMETEAGPPAPDRFRSLPGSVFPLYHVLADVGEFAGGQVIPTHSSDTLRIDGLALRRGDKTRVLIANLSPQVQKVTVQDLGQTLSVRRLDETNAEDAMQLPESFRSQAGERAETAAGVLELDLLPYAVVRIDTA